jgi:hypothetical protein
VFISITSPNSIFEDSAHGVADTINAREEEAYDGRSYHVKGRGSLAIIVSGFRTIELLGGLEAYA